MRRILLALCFVAAIVQAQEVPKADDQRPEAATQSPATAQPETPQQAAAQAVPESAPAVVVSSVPQLLRRDGRPVQSSPATLLVTSFERHGHMRRERDEEFAVVLCRQSGNLKTCPPWNVGGADGLSPVALEMKDVAGLTVRYREGKEYASLSEGGPVRTSQGLDVFRFKVRPEKDFPLGITTLEGKLTFQRVHEGKLSAPETIAVSIPVTVVKHDTEVAENYWAIDPAKHHPLEGFGEVLLYIVAAPILLPFIIGCCINSNCE